MDTRIPVQNDAQHPAPSSAYPKEWSLSTIPESAESSQATVRGDFPIALSDLDKSTPAATTPSTFEANWALPRNAGSERDAPYGEFGNASWSPGVMRRGVHDPYPDTAAAIPRHPLDRVLHGQHPDTSPSGVPGNFKPQGYSDFQVSPSIRAGPTSSESANVAANGIIRRVVGQYHHASPASAISGATTASSASDVGEVIAGQVRFGPQFATTSPLSPRGNASSSYQAPRPAGFTSHQITPQSAAETDSASAELYHPPRPAGFGPENISPATSGSMSVQNQLAASRLQHDPRAHPDSLPAIPERRGSGRAFAPITIPDQASTLPDKVNSWLYADRDQLYKPPAAPLTATAPWHPQFQ
ncbi:hypothetical protein CMUS01_08377 [Colletotrichum musicola]|uniref:Uncharacterized protein n=1 Tax=Colletotrichum musicola TaxID=2175873 RepID=A0A8H6KD75_9PEZI|nr:hypothetical protein CMUS01_08377 [Colletotrichum musicola]